MRLSPQGCSRRPGRPPSPTAAARSRPGPRRWCRRDRWGRRLDGVGVVQKQVKEKGKAYDDKGIAFEGQHMKSVSAYPQYQDDPRNIQFLSREEHLAAHGGNWKNQTNCYYDRTSKSMSDFGNGPPQPCVEMVLTNPLYVDPPDASGIQTSGSESKSGNSLADATAAPTGSLRELTQSLLARRPVGVEGSTRAGRGRFCHRRGGYGSAQPPQVCGEKSHQMLPTQPFMRAASGPGTESPPGGRRFP